MSRRCSATRESNPAKPQRIFLSSTCLDLVDLRSGLKESLEDMGYQVWASEFPDFPVDSSLHAHDNCLRNVENADQYVLILNDRYGAAYEGTAYPKHPLPDDPKRSISVTWYEYLRALHCGKPIRILVRERIWDQRSVFQAARKSGTDLKETGVPPELFDFLEFVCSQLGSGPRACCRRDRKNVCFGAVLGPTAVTSPPAPFATAVLRTSASQLWGFVAPGLSYNSPHGSLVASGLSGRPANMTCSSQERKPGVRCVELDCLEPVIRS